MAIKASTSDLVRPYRHLLTEGQSWSSLSTMELHRISNDDPATFAELRRSVGGPAEEKGAALTTEKRGEGVAVVAIIEQLGTMGMHRLLNDKPEDALALYSSAAAVDPERFAGHVRSARQLAAARGADARPLPAVVASLSFGK